MAKKTEKIKSTKQVEKPVSSRFVGKVKSKAPSEVKTKKLESGGAVEQPFSCRLITYEIGSNSSNEYFVNQFIRTETLVDIPQDYSNDKIIDLLKEKGILTEKANKDNIRIDGDKNSTVFIIDSEKNMPLFELQNIKEFEGGLSGDTINPSELIKQEYFKTTEPIKDSVVPVENVNSSLSGQATQVEKTIDAVNDAVNDGVKNESGLILPTYDTTQESVIRQHVIGNEIHIVHLTNILARQPKYEESIGGLRLRKSFFRDYYKII